MTNRKWDRLRAKGYTKYSLLDGLLLKGSSFLTGFCVASPFVFDSAGLFLEALSHAVVALPLGGLVANIVLWPVYERMFVAKNNRTTKRTSNWKKTSGNSARKRTVTKLRPKTA